MDTIMTQNDQEILNLKKEIATKKSSIKKDDFKPKTNLMLTINGHNYNLNVLTKFELMYLASQLIAVKDTMFKMGVDDVLEIGGFPIQDWIDDLKGKYANLKYKTEIKNLEDIEKRLHNLISSDLKTSMELTDIKKILNV
jgi:hypothetical protein